MTATIPLSRGKFAIVSHEDIGEVLTGFMMGCIVIAGGAIGWATASPQPAGQASAPSLFHVSAKGDHQALGVSK